MELIREIFIAFGLGITSVVNASASVQLDVYGCENCSLNQAKEIAIQEAEPRINCRAPYGEIDITDENQQCYSNPRRYYVVDKSRPRVYGFALSHLNQGGHDMELQLQVEEISVDSRTRNAIVETANYYDHIEGTIEHLSNKFSKRYTSPQQFNAASSRMGRATASSADCTSNPSYQALYNAFSPGFRSELVIGLNRDFDTLNNRHHNHFREVEFSDASFFASTDGFGVNYQVRAVTNNKYIKFEYNWGNIPIVDPPTIVFTLSIDRDGVDATLNEKLTVVDGMSIRQMRDPLAVRESANQLSACALKALDFFFDSSKEATDGGGGPVSGDGSGGGSGSGTGWPGGSGGSSGGTPKCRQHYYWPSGEIAFTMLVSCA